MQDAENVAAPEAAEERAEPARQQPASESPPADEAVGSGGSEVGRTEDAEEDSEAGPEPEVRAKPAAQPEEETATSPAVSPQPAERSSAQEPSAPGKAEAAGEQAREHSAGGAEEEGGSDGSAAEAEPRALENGGADEPSFSDPEDFVDDVSEEGKGCDRERVYGEGILGCRRGREVFRLQRSAPIFSKVGDHLGSPPLREDRASRVGRGQDKLQYPGHCSFLATVSSVDQLDPLRAEWEGQVVWIVVPSPLQKYLPHDFQVRHCRLTQPHSRLLIFFFPWSVPLTILVLGIAFSHCSFCSLLHIPLYGDWFCVLHGSLVPKIFDDS